MLLWFRGGGTAAGGGGGSGLSMRVEVYNTSAFTSPVDVSADLLGVAGLTVKYGIDGNGPLDRVASTGELHFALRNDDGNSASLEGYYSPNHANVRSGWAFGKYVRVIFTDNSIDYIKFTGKIRSILPDAGKHGPRRVGVVAYDGMRDLMEANAREVTIQVNQTETALLNALIAAVPVNAQPIATDFDTGVDLYPYAFDNVSGDTKALAVMRDVVVSSFGLLFQKGDGTLSYMSRHALALLSSSTSFTDANMFELSVPSTLDGVFDQARATIHPKQVSATPTDELYAIPTGTAIEVGIGATVEVWTDYTDPLDRTINIGGTSVVTPLVAGTHYAAFEFPDGTGTDLTAGIVAAIDAFGSTAKWTLTNNNAMIAHMTVLTPIGKAVRDPGPQTFQTPAGAGDHPIDIDLPYQDDPYIGKSVTSYVVANYSTLTHQIESLSFVASKSDALTLQALQREPGDLITVTETMTGVTSVLAVIQSVNLSVSLSRQGVHLTCRWGLAPANGLRSWLLGVVGRSELGQTTVLGF